MGDGDDFRGVVDLVESIDKRLILDLETAINRQGLTRAFEWWSNRLDTTPTRQGRYIYNIYKRIKVGVVVVVVVVGVDLNLVEEIEEKSIFSASLHHRLD